MAHDLKLAWGMILAYIFLLLVVSFVRSIRKQRGIIYNWFGVLLLFLAVGLAIYLIFFVQI